MTRTRREFLAAAAGACLAKPLTASKPKFRLGLVTYNVARDWDLPTILRICRAAGVAALECRTTHKHGVEPSLNRDDRRRVRKQFDESAVVFWGCGTVCEFHSAEDAEVRRQIETCKQFLQLVADLGGRGVKVRPNGLVPGKTPEGSFQQIGEALVTCGKAAADLGLEVWVEVHGKITQEPASMKAIMEACGHPAVGICWNSNATDVANGSIAAAFDLLKPHLMSCHINDLANDAAGRYPYRELFSKLTETGYDRYTLCEVNTPVQPDEGEAWLKKYADQWRRLTGLA